MKKSNIPSLATKNIKERTSIQGQTFLFEIEFPIRKSSFLYTLIYLHFEKWALKGLVSHE